MNALTITICIIVPYIATVLGVGSATLIRSPKKSTEDVMLGFAAGVMLAATVWGLLLPAVGAIQTYRAGIYAGVGIVTLGFLSGIGCMLLLDAVLPHIHAATNEREGVKTHMPRSLLLVMAVALHNIPEGLALGVALGATLSGDTMSVGGALAMCVGIAIQNFPEGLAVTFPLIKEGVSRKRSFWFGQISSIAEPICTVAGVFLALWLGPILPVLLSFAAGAMLFVIAEELIPGSQSEHGHAGTYGLMGGFWVMVIISVLLG